MRSSVLVIFTCVATSLAHPQGGYIPDNAIKSQVGLGFQYRYQPTEGEFGFPSEHDRVPDSATIVEKNLQSAQSTRQLGELFKAISVQDLQDLIGPLSDGFNIKGGQETVNMGDFLDRLASYLEAHSSSIANVAASAQEANIPINTIGGSYIGLK